MSGRACRRRGARRSYLRGRMLRPIAALVGVVALAGVAQAVPVELTLQGAVNMALEKNRQVAMARAGVDAADARLGEARAAYFPAISAAASYTRLDEAPYMDTSQFGSIFAPLLAPFEYLVEQGYLDPSTLEGLENTGGGGKIYLGDDDIYSVGLTVTQPIFTGGAILSSHGAARHAARAEQLNAIRTSDQVRYDATQAYVALVQSKAALQAMDDAVSEMQSHMSDLQAMYDAGALLKSDLMLAKVRLSDVELARSQARHAVDVAASALGFVIGLGPDAEIEPIDGLEMEIKDDRDLDAWTEVALDARPDLKSADEMVGAAGNYVSLARSGYFPNLVATGSYMWDRPNREYEQEFYDHWSVTLALQMNVFDWGLTGNRVKEARAGLAQARSGYEMMQDAVRLEVRQAYLRREEARDAAAIAEAGLEQARESMRVTRESFKAGQATNSDVLSAQAALTKAWMNRIGALAGVRIAEAGLELATGVDVADEETR